MKGEYLKSIYIISHNKENGISHITLTQQKKLKPKLPSSEEKSFKHIESEEKEKNRQIDYPYPFQGKLIEGGNHC